MRLLKTKLQFVEKFLGVQTRESESLGKKAVTNRVEKEAIVVEYFIGYYKDKKLSQRLHMSVEDIKKVFHSLQTSMSREFKRTQKDNDCVST